MSTEASGTQQNEPFQQAPAAPKPPGPLSAVSQEVGYEIPVDNAKLPSKGLLYPTTHPLSNEENVEIKCMTAKEEDLLTSPALIKNGTVISRLLSSCMLNKLVDPDDLLVGDRNAILIAIRITGYGPDYSGKVTCPDCGEQYEADFSLSGLAIKPLTAQPLHPNTNLFEYILPSERRVTFKLLTGQEEAEISQVATRRKKMGSQVEGNVTSRLHYAIESIGSETDKAKIKRLIDYMPARDARALRAHIDKIEPGVQMKQWAKCTQCGEESEVPVPLGISFFWPDFE